MRRLVATLSGLALVLSGAGADARSLQNDDALQGAKPAGRAAVGFKPGSPPGARVSQRDSLTGSPTFVWGRKGAAQEQLRARYAGMAPEQAALAQLEAHAPLYGVSSFAAAGARVNGVSQDRQGVTVVKVTQEASGIEVFRQSLNLLLDRNNELVASSGALSRHVSCADAAARLRFSLPAARAISAAYQDLTGAALDAALLERVGGKQDAGRYMHFQLASSARPPAEGLLVPALDTESATFSFRLTVTDALGASHSVTAEATASPDDGGGCASTGAGAPAAMLGLALLALVRCRRQH